MYTLSNSVMHISMALSNTVMNKQHVVMNVFGQEEIIQHVTFIHVITLSAYMVKGHIKRNSIVFVSIQQTKP